MLRRMRRKEYSTVSHTEGAKARASLRLESGATRVPGLGFRRQARWLKAPGRQDTECAVES
jgi:hypothetical protein